MAKVDPKILIVGDEDCKIGDLVLLVKDSTSFYIKWPMVAYSLGVSGPTIEWLKVRIIIGISQPCEVYMRILEKFRMKKGNNASLDFLLKTLLKWGVQDVHDRIARECNIIFEQVPKVPSGESTREQHNQTQMEAEPMPKPLTRPVKIPERPQQPTAIETVQEPKASNTLIVPRKRVPFTIFAAVTAVVFALIFMNFMLDKEANSARTLSKDAMRRAITGRGKIQRKG